MDVNEAIERLRPFEKGVPKEAVDAVRENWAEAEPLLLAELDRLIECPLAEHSALFTYAVYLCAEMCCESAFERYVALCRMPDLAQDYLLGDALHESMGEMLQRTCANRFEVLKELVEDETVNEYARSCALEALMNLTLAGEFPREEAEAYCLDLFGSKLEQQNRFVWNQVVTFAVSLRLKKAIPLIRLAYQAGWADSMGVSMESVLKKLRQPKSAEPKTFRSTEDIVSLFARQWADWSPGGGDVSDSDLLTPLRMHWRKKRVAGGKEPGRNDPCPCGSGKKYKKCCIGVGLVVSEATEDDGSDFVSKNEADEWIAAGYFYQKEYGSQKTLLCWGRAWEGVPKFLPNSALDPYANECDEFFDGAVCFGDWILDYLTCLVESASRSVTVLRAGMQFADEALALFPEMDEDLLADFGQAKIKMRLWLGEKEQAFRLLEALKKQASNPVVWLRFEADLFGWEAPKYNLCTDFSRVLQLVAEAQMNELNPEYKALYCDQIEGLKALLREDQAERGQRAAIVNRPEEKQLELFGE